MRMKKIERFKKTMRKAADMVSQKVAMLALMLLFAPAALMAQNTAGDYTAGTNALTTVAEENAFWLNHTQIKYDKMNIKLKKTRYK